MPFDSQGLYAAGVEGPEAINEITAWKETSQCGAFLRATYVEAPPADGPSLSPLRLCLQTMPKSFTVLLHSVDRLGTLGAEQPGRGWLRLCKLH